MDADPSRRLGLAKAQETVSFLRNKVLEAQVALYRGFIHEVNNALAGVGTLAEALVGVEASTAEPNLKLIVNATGKSAQLQRRIRALISEGEETLTSLEAFLEENVDLLELMLPREQRLELQNSEQAKLSVKASVPMLWQLVSVLVLWVKDSQAAGATISLLPQGVLKVTLREPQSATLDERWAEAIEAAASAVGAEGFLGGNEIAIVWG